jgi:hypothetical protein
MNIKTKIAAAGAATIAASALGLGTAYAATPTPHAIIPQWVNCSTWTSGTEGGANCSGTGWWRVAVYCDWPSPSPVYSGWKYGAGSNAAGCWFGKNAQVARVEQ